MPYFKVYTTYCTNQSFALTIMNKCKEKYTAFVAFLQVLPSQTMWFQEDWSNEGAQECQEDPVCRRLNLFSFLIKPVQRYVLS